ncbi:MAG: F0F1 ATP synthase subunit A [Proteobacteria bacterium]|nr:F0F1 ATP synthase subunit A [Pseudomonadota bacterium]NCA27900.1 F0F1 ATP synthase subunit A [Pseudomonadota bacterium]
MEQKTKENSLLRNKNSAQNIDKNSSDPEISNSAKINPKNDPQSSENLQNSEHSHQESDHETHQKHSPLDQFKIKEIYPLHIGNYNFSFTNSALYMVIATALIIIFMLKATSRKLLIPSRTQMIAESIYNFIYNLIDGSIGAEGKKFMPLVFSIFTFILLCNCLGMTPYSFTATSQVAVTLSIAMMCFLIITIYAIVRNGFGGFIHMFLPSGVPIWMAPVIFIIELFSFLIRPITLSVRLFANMVAGHVLLKVIAGFIISLGILGALPFLFSIVMTGFELFVAVLQAYIFSILVCAYLSETMKAH